jgi:iron(III) transport system substrate-binding protein
VDAFTAKHPDVEVEWIRDGTTKVMAKLAAEFEAGAPQPDVLLIADMVTMEGLKAEGRLMAHEGADISAYDPAIMDDEKFYFSTKLITTGIVYNTAAEMVPTSYTDLLDEAAKDRIAMPSPLTSGAATIHMAALTANPDLGWAYYEGLADQGANPQGGNGGTYRAIAGGEKLYGFVVDFLPIREKANGAPVEFVFPEEGVSAVTEPVAILSTAQNPEAAKAFVDFLLSPEGQQLAADQGYLAAHPDIAPPEGFPARDQIKLMDFDPAAALENDAANKERFVDIFGG